MHGVRLIMRAKEVALPLELPMRKCFAVQMTRTRS